jgi:hypothetical protein
MTKQLTENTPVIIRVGIVIAMIVSLCVWFHARVNALEMQQVEQKTDIKYIKEAVDDIRREVRK